MLLAEMLDVERSVTGNAWRCRDCDAPIRRNKSGRCRPCLTGAKHRFACPTCGHTIASDLADLKPACFHWGTPYRNGKWTRMVAL